LVAISSLPLRIPEKFAELRPVFDLLRTAILTRIEAAAMAGSTNSVEWRFQESSSNAWLSRLGLSRADSALTAAATAQNAADANTARLKELTFQEY
jgi:hypothetical protein